jgi:hypothetical protein
LKLLSGAGDVEVDACVVIHLLGCGEIKLVDRDIAAMLIADVESGPGQGIVVNLLRGATVFEDERDGILVLGCGRCWCRLRLCIRLLSGRLFLIGRLLLIRRWWALIGGLLSISFDRIVGLTH